MGRCENPSLVLYIYIIYYYYYYYTHTLRAREGIIIKWEKGLQAAGRTRFQAQ